MENKHPTIRQELKVLDAEFPKELFDLTVEYIGDPDKPFTKFYSGLSNEPPMEAMHYMGIIASGNLADITKYEGEMKFTHFKICEVAAQYGQINVLEHYKYQNFTAKEKAELGWILADFNPDLASEFFTEPNAGIGFVFVRENRFDLLSKNNVEFSNAMLTKAINVGNFSIFKFLHEEKKIDGENISRKIISGPSYKIFAYAKEHNMLEKLVDDIVLVSFDIYEEMKSNYHVLFLPREDNYRMKGIKFDWTCGALYATEFGHEDMLEFILKNHLSEIQEHSIKIYHSMKTYAMIEKYPSLMDKNKSLEYACSGNQVEIVYHLKTKFKPFSDEAIIACLEGGKLSYIKDIALPRHIAACKIESKYLVNNQK